MTDASLESLRGLLPDREIAACSALLDKCSTPAKARRWLRELARKEAEVQAMQTAYRAVTDERADP